VTKFNAGQRGAWSCIKGHAASSRPWTNKRAAPTAPACRWASFLSLSGACKQRELRYQPSLDPQAHHIGEIDIIKSFALLSYGNEAENSETDLGCCSLPLA
jgi:hypothetical protein